MTRYRFHSRNSVEQVAYDIPKADLDEHLDLLIPSHRDKTRCGVPHLGRSCPVHRVLRQVLRNVEVHCDCAYFRHVRRFSSNLCRIRSDAVVVVDTH